MAAYVIGDISAQLASSRARRFPDKLTQLDVARTGRMALYGLMWCGPAGHRFYRWLDKVRVTLLLPAFCYSIVLFVVIVEVWRCRA